MTNTEITYIRPVAARRLVPQSVRGFGFDRDTLRFDTHDGIVEVPLHEAHIEQNTSWLVLKRVTLSLPTGVFDLDGITHDAAQSVERAIREAQRRHAIVTKLQLQASAVAEVVRAWDTLATKDAYLTASDVERWSRGVGHYITPEASDADIIDKLPPVDVLALQRLTTVRANPRATADQRNAAYVQQQLQSHKAFFDTVESKPLTEAQRLAVARDEENALVIAGAGTGKTSTLVAKVGFLLAKGWAKPDEILLLAYTRDAATEMRERVKRRLNADLNVRTFHALGLEIIAKASGKKPSLCPEAEDQAVKAATLKELVAKRLSDEAFRHDYLAFQARPRKPYKAEWEFKSQSEYVQYLLDVETRALSGVRVKSYEECEIANWLLLSGIRFEYERRYVVDTATAEHRQYKPDFYLPDDDIYIEHWGVDHNGQTARFVNQEEYAEKMAWARGIHEQHGTRLVETYSWERQENVLLPNLEAKLRALGVTFAPISQQAALDILNESGRTDPFINLLGSFISHFKSAGHTIASVQAKAGIGGDKSRDTAFLRLFETLFGDYQALLNARGEIDFDDMIAVASAYVQNRSYTSPFRYILVDEFQDISLGRAKLIDRLKQQAVGAKLFAVGDDWQSIYRFSGSNITLTTEFERFFGFTCKTSLERTFRFHDKIADFTGRFVQKNPDQLPKQLTSDVTSVGAGVTLWSEDGSSSALIPILSEIGKDGMPHSILMLGRYRHSLPNKAVLGALHHRFPHLILRAMTAHASKGLEADYVIVMDVNQGKYGFPSEIADDPVLHMVLPESERYPFAEERRLFYVALTRAKRHVFVVSDAGSPSIFVREIVGDAGFEKIIAGGVAVSQSVCPLCERGTITKRTGDFGDFYSCSNYPVCPYKPAACPRCKWGWMRNASQNEAHCISCGFHARRCPRCESGVLVERRARAGNRPPFWGCTNYGRSTGSCEYKASISRPDL